MEERANRLRAGTTKTRRMFKRTPRVYMLFCLTTHKICHKEERLTQLTYIRPKTCFTTIVKYDLRVCAWTTHVELA